MSLVQRLRDLLRPGEARAGPAPQRLVVLDVEASGLDARTDRLISIAAIGLRVQSSGAQPERLCIDYRDSFEVVLQSAPARPEDWVRPSSQAKANVLIHGIGMGAQAAGVPAADALSDFARYVGKAPLLGYHVGFDRILLERGFAEQRLPALGSRWLDLEDLARGVNRQLRRLALDAWLARYGIECALRHDAAADTLATAQLVLRLTHQLQWPAGEMWAQLLRVAGDARFLDQR